ncbi:MAG: toll/interleukin-1 receptor domain-containing protein, partial [Myxococcales bacterium]|nr:toll/interleukin-1 receptor domain-containing protein [Myxococcales bacterium]
MLVFQVEPLALAPASEMIAPSAKQPASFSIWERVKLRLFGFDAFISYTHADGLAYAMALENRLIERGYVVFRDAHEIQAGARLWDTIMAALRRSRMLIVVDSPAAIESTWVQDEQRYFLEVHGRRRAKKADAYPLIRVIFDDPTGQDAKLINERPEHLALPRVADETVAALEDSRAFSLTNTRAMWTVAAVVVVLIGLLAFSVWQFVLAVKARDDAESQRDIARGQRVRAETIRLSAEAGDSRDVAIQRALLLAAEAEQHTSGTDGHLVSRTGQALIDVHHTAASIPLLSGGKPLFGVTLDARGETIAAWAEEPLMQLWFAAERPPRSTTLRSSHPFVDAHLSRDGKTLITLDASGALVEWTVSGEGVETKATIARGLTVEPKADNPWYGHKSALWVGPEDDVLIAGKQLWLLEGDVWAPQLPFSAMVDDVAFAHQRALVATSSHIELVEFADGVVQFRRHELPPDDSDEPTWVALSEDGRWAMSTFGGWRRMISLWDLEASETLEPLPIETSASCPEELPAAFPLGFTTAPLQAFAVDQDGRVIWSELGAGVARFECLALNGETREDGYSEGEIRRMQPRTATWIEGGLLVGSELASYWQVGDTVADVAHYRDVPMPQSLAQIDGTFYAGLRDGGLARWRPDSRRPAEIRRGHEQNLNYLEPSADGRRLLSASILSSEGVNDGTRPQRGEARLWILDGSAEMPPELLVHDHEQVAGSSPCETTIEPFEVTVTWAPDAQSLAVHEQWFESDRCSTTHLWAREGVRFEEREVRDMRSLALGDSLAVAVSGASQNWIGTMDVDDPKVWLGTSRGPITEPREFDAGFNAIE